MTKHNYTWFCHECDEKISIPSVNNSGEECCPNCKSTNLSPIFHCIQCGYELEDHRDLCDVCDADRYPQPEKIEHWRARDAKYATMTYPDMEIIVSFHGRSSKYFVDAEFHILNTNVEMTGRNSITTRREVRKAIAEIHQLHAKLKGSKL